VYVIDLASANATVVSSAVKRRHCGRLVYIIDLASANVTVVSSTVIDRPVIEIHISCTPVACFKNEISLNFPQNNRGLKKIRPSLSHNLKFDSTVFEMFPSHP
jgi:hypothetical protein